MSSAPDQPDAAPDATPPAPQPAVSAALYDAMAAVSRADFAPLELQGAPGLEGYLPIAEGQSLPPVRVLARMIDALEIQPGDRVLHVGTGTGYTAAILGQLAGEVFTIERVPSLADAANTRLVAAGAANVTVVVADGASGWPHEAPYDAILVTAALHRPQEALLEQLAVGGRLVIAVGPHRRMQTLRRVRRKAEGQFEEEDLGEIRLARAIGDLLVDMGSAKREAVELAAHEAAESGVPIGRQLVDEGVLSEADLYRALARQRGLRFSDVRSLMERLDPKLVGSLPEKFLRHNRLLPIERLDNAIVVATPDPDAQIADLSAAAGVEEMLVYLVCPTDYRRLWTAYELQGSRPEGTDRIEKPQQIDLLEEESGQEAAHYIALLDALLLEAASERASDVHFEVYGSRVRLRVRVDGELRDLKGYEITPRELRGVINVLKVRSQIDIAERRLPQGGRHSVRVGGQVYDLRVQTQPTLHGEYAVIRLLAQKTQLLTIEDLGFPKVIADQYRRLLRSPAGLVLSVGPTGSGKSTTLYAGLSLLANDATRKVITAEDPVEYSIDGIEQTQIHSGIGFSFADAMRSFVRQDPDVILVGEIRDAETALEAIRASQTGHVVLSTLHCNDAVDAVQRLVDLGMHPNSIASELLAVMAQRLAKRICTFCKEQVEPDAEIMAELFPDGAPGDFTAFKGKGCRMCGDHGTRGRIGVVEFLRATEDVRGGISATKPVDELRRIALRTGLLPMRDQGVELARQGVIPLSELPRILPAERMAPEKRD